ncbi:MAG TPA: hypothetical protein DDY88_02265, partial [Actinobacteria bacterium]|nr:hypothetical protein [Actinomycetota bacterium]
VQEAASESLVATVGVIQHLQGFPASLIATFQDSAFDAFLSASHVTTILSLSIVVIAALLVGFGLPNIQAPTQGHAPSGPADDPMDALVKEEGAAYAQEAAQEYEQKEKTE